MYITMNMIDKMSIQATLQSTIFTRCVSDDVIGVMNWK